MAEFQFISPSIKFSEGDFTTRSEQLGVTSLGLIGETPKGAAFTPVSIRSVQQLRSLFGFQSPEKHNNQPKYPLMYAANSFLAESNNLTITRVLGLSGYNAGNGWAITTLGGADTSTVTGGSTFSVTGATTTTGLFMGSILPSIVGQSISIQPDYVRQASTFTGTGYTVQITDIVSLGGVTTHTFNYTGQTFTCGVLQEYENMVVAIIRPRATYNLDNLVFNADNISVISNNALTNALNTFTIRATKTAPFRTEDYEVTLDVTRRDFISKVLGDKAKGKNTMLYVEAVYPDLIQKLALDNLIYGINTSPVQLLGNSFTQYLEQYKSAETPWIVSEIRGNTVERLFKFVTITDGNSANKDVKISIVNINPETREFDVIIRSFNDTDEVQEILETYTRCSMNESLPNYIGKRIGAVDLENSTDFKYDQRSSYVYLVLQTDHPQDAFPAGFEGYNQRSFDMSETGSSTILPPKILYKTSYLDTDKLSRTYLGISEKAYNSDFSTATSINQNLFNYFGKTDDPDRLSKTKGFHLDSDVNGVTYIDGDVNIGEFIGGLGSFKSVLDVNDTSNPYNRVATRKFTLVPYGGFDGWDEHRTNRTNDDAYKTGTLRYFNTSDWVAYSRAIETFANSEEVEVNVIATPNLNWNDHNSLVAELLRIVEEERGGDAIYIIDPPDIKGSDLASSLAELFTIANIDSSYAATYAPWIEILDGTNDNRRIFMPPSVEVVRSFALTDNRANPWWSPAGLNRGSVNALNTRKKISESERDTMYKVNINPIAQFNDVGTTIFGQKTTLRRISALDRVNVRRLLITIKKSIATISKGLLFEQNDEIVREQFLNQVNPLLENIKRERGLYDFRIIMDGASPELLDRNEMQATLLLKPTRTLEYIRVNLNLVPTGASFDDF